MNVGKGLLGCGVLIGVLLVTVSYIAVGVLGLDPREQTYSVSVTMNQTSGLMATSSVSMHGMEIGDVDSILTDTTGVTVRLRINDRYRVPIASRVIVQNLSAAGEQYLDFRPESSAGPYLSDGAMVPVAQVDDAPTIGSVLSKVDRLAELIDPDVVVRLGAMLKAVTADESVLADAASTVDLMRTTLRDKTPIISSMFRLGQEFDRRIMAMDGPARLAPVGATLERLAPALNSVLTELGAFGAMSARTDAWNGQIGPFMDGLLTKLSVLVPEFGNIAAALLPVTGQLRRIRVDANAFTDLWGRAFPPGGPMRVEVTVR
ncbi:MlaD family protein [Gordonia malaquae]|uniref:MlaD family protein n=1 Tax=Gordonia malaquae TaxID=410332 RepID=UPI0030FE1ADB